MNRSIALLIVLCSAVPLEARCQSTAEDRATLFDYILAKTMEREAFSPAKNHALAFDVEEAMLRYRDEFVAADTPEELYYALARLSNARKDRHLSLAFVDGGIALSDTAGADQGNYHAPIRFATDYGTPGEHFVFVSDVAEDIARHTTSAAPEVGDRLIAINGRPFPDYVEQIEPYHRYSSVNGLWWQIAMWIPQKTFLFPPHFYRDDLQLELERPNGGRYSVALPYMSRDDIPWGASLEINPRPPDEDEDEEDALRRRPVPLLLYDLWSDHFALHSVHEERPDLVEKYTAFLEAQWEAHQALAQRFTPGDEVQLTPDQLRTLRALGYIQ